MPSPVKMMSRQGILLLLLRVLLPVATESRLASGSVEDRGYLARCIVFLLSLVGWCLRRISARVLKTSKWQTKGIFGENADQEIFFLQQRLKKKKPNADGLVSAFRGL
jgi:hypothetical protein